VQNVYSNDEVGGFRKHMPKLTCPKCGNDTFKISLSERQETYNTESATHKLEILTILNVTCAKCGWNKHFRRPPEKTIL
jgi:predicted nucleic-acid-binding Zn-ribbon protein